VGRGRVPLGMTFKAPFWRPAAFVLTGVNLVGVGFAAGAAEPWHAGVHAVLALAFWSWAQRLRQRREESGRFPQVEALELEMGDLRRELGEVQERLDFTERMLAQRSDARGLDPAHTRARPPGP
jgi:hypothetical protein